MSGSRRGSRACRWILAARSISEPFDVRARHGPWRFIAPFSTLLHACATPLRGRMASVMRLSSGEKVRALFAQIDLCGAKSACRSSAGDERRNGRRRPSRGSRSRSDASSTRARCTNAGCKKCLYLCALRKHRMKERCVRGESPLRRHRRSMRPAADRREPRREKFCVGLLTCRKTVIRFRPADDSCGIE